MDIKLVGTYPVYTKLFPEKGAIGQKAIIRQLKFMHLRDVVLILSKLSMLRYKYFLDSGWREERGEGSMREGKFEYRKRCIGLLDEKSSTALYESENKHRKQYDVIFPELSIAYLIRLALKYCNNDTYTEGELGVDVIGTVGNLLLIANSLVGRGQGAVNKKYSSEEEKDREIFVKLVRSAAADIGIDLTQKNYQTYFIFQYLIEVGEEENVDIEKVFEKIFKITVKEFFAFIFLLQSHYKVGVENCDKAGAYPQLSRSEALKNIDDKYQIKLLDNFDIKKNKGNKNFYIFNLNSLRRYPLVCIGKDKLFLLSCTQFFHGTTGSLYFHMIERYTGKVDMSDLFGNAIEKYVVNIMKNIDTNTIKEFKFPRTGRSKESKKTSDAILPIGQDIVFMEVKKRKFATEEFLNNGEVDIFFDRAIEYYKKPLEQICKRIKDFRNKEYTVNDMDSGAKVYPIIVTPEAAPMFSGGWDVHKMHKYILPNYYNEDNDIALPEYMSIDELEYIEAYIKKNPQKTLIDLIEMKRKDPQYPNSNWIVFLSKNDMVMRNTRLIGRFLEETKEYKKILFNK